MQQCEGCCHAPVCPSQIPAVHLGSPEKILGFAPSGLGAACCGVASAVLRICPCHAGIVMFAVGVGKAVEEELRAIASEPVEQHFSYSADFTTMTHLVENFSLNICPGGCPCHTKGLAPKPGKALLSPQSQWGGLCVCHTVSSTPRLGWAGVSLGCLRSSLGCCGYRCGSLAGIWKRKR